MTGAATRAGFGRNGLNRFTAPTATGARLDRAAEIEFLRDAVRRRVEETSIRQVALEVKMSHGGIYNFVIGTVVPYGKTLAKVRAWYLALWAEGGEGLSPDAARYLIAQMLGPIPRRVRETAQGEFLDGVEALFRRYGRSLPVWLHELRRESRPVTVGNQTKRRPAWRIRGALGRIRKRGGVRQLRRRIRRVQVPPRKVWRGASMRSRCTGSSRRFSRRT